MATEQKELVLLHSEWMLRRTKDMIQNELPNKGMRVFEEVLRGANHSEVHGEI